MRITALLALLLAVPVFAQESGPKFFRLDFVVKELDENKVVSTRNYSGIANTDEKRRGTSIRMGNKIAYQTGGGFQFFDVGVNIDVQRTEELNGQLMMAVVAEVTSTASGEAPSTLPPLIRQNKWNSTVIIPVGKATTLFSSDDLHSKRKLQLEVTATPVK